MVARNESLADAMGFLDPENYGSPSRLLLVRGESGAGKTFWTKSLLFDFATRCPEAIILYADIDESEFESSDLETRLIALASHPAKASKSDPQQMPAQRCLSFYSKRRSALQHISRATFRVARTAIELVPVIGTALKSAFPEEYPESRLRALSGAGKPWEFLAAAAEKAPVIVALDNVQFLPRSVRMEIDTRLAVSESGFRFVVIERLADEHQPSWQFRCFQSHRHQVDIGPLSKDSSDDLVRRILGTGVTRLPEVSAAIYRKSLGNPKQVWLQLRSIMQGAQRASANDCSPYEELIVHLPVLDRLILQLVTLLIGGLRLDDIVSITHGIAQSTSKPDIHQSITDLVAIGFLIINGSTSDRVRTEHELVRTTIRNTTTEAELLGLRQSAILALTQHIDSVGTDPEKERLSDRLVGLLTAAELRANKKHVVRVASLVGYQAEKGRYHYLVTLFFESPVGEILDLLPDSCLLAFLDAFQKASSFDSGLVAIEMIRQKRPDHARFLALFAAKYHVQKFQYREAERLLGEISADTESEAIRFNIILNICRDAEARDMVAALPVSTPLDEFQSVILRNSAHLFGEESARRNLERAQREFSRLGLKFAVATTRNNRGVLELWAGNLDIAQRELQAAQRAFQDFGSNEVYQPLNNLAVLEAVRGNYQTAQRLLQMAKDTVSADLSMDALMLEHNALGLQLLQREISLERATTELRRLYRASLDTRDQRFQDVLALCLSELETAQRAQCSNRPPAEFMESLQSRSTSGIEIAISAKVGNAPLTLWFVLSPHWRY